MKTRAIITTAAAAAIVTAAAFDIVWINTTDGVARGLALEKAESIAYSGDKTNLVVTDKTYTAHEIAVSDVQDITLGESDGVVTVNFTSDGPKVDNPFAFEGLDVTIDGGHVTINYAGEEKLSYYVTGTTDDGQLKLYGAAQYTLTIENASITNQSGAAINIQNKKKGSINIKGSNLLVDSEEYVTPDDEKQNGCFFSTGTVTFSGSGTMTVAGYNKHAIASSMEINLDGATLIVTAAASDGLHADDITITSGSYTCSGTTGDAIDADTGVLQIDGGTIDVTVPTDDTKGFKADDMINVTGGDITMKLSGAQSKGFKTKASMTVSGGTITANATGGVVVTNGDPSYCTVVKSDVDFTMTGGTINITHSGIAGKGISADGDATFTDGNVTITTTGAGGTYQDANGDNDSYCSTCISVDGNLYMQGGTFNLSSSGSAGKCMKVDLVATLGNEDGTGPDVTAKTSGAQVLVGSSSSGGNWGGWGPGGSGQDKDYANPKIIKATGNMTINGGTYNLTGSTEGGEALESKATLTINDGTLKIKTYDDCINAATHIQINGGDICCQATGNDAIDSNGTLTIAGGRVIAVGKGSPECGFDCDQNRFTITGGEIWGIGGDTSTPTSSYCTQRCVVYSRSSASANTRYTVSDTSGNVVLSFVAPASISGTCKMVISSPSIAASTSYKISTGGTVSGGDTFEYLTVGGTLSSGTQATTFTSSSMVTTVGSSSGGRP
ncbi:MAG: carbohydrate-binding domain-containing protein [Bacteroidales bacterium]|nr:carbohydrate-binding domain-containing protein [Bacteroidales bacterium]